MKLEESPLAEVVAILDPEDAGSFSLVDLLEAALSTAEEKNVRSSLCCISPPFVEIFYLGLITDRNRRINYRFSLPDSVSVHLISLFFFPALYSGQPYIKRFSCPDFTFNLVSSLSTVSVCHFW